MGLMWKTNKNHTKKTAFSFLNSLLLSYYILVSISSRPITVRGQREGESASLTLWISRTSRNICPSAGSLWPGLPTYPYRTRAIPRPAASSWSRQTRCCTCGSSGPWWTGSAGCGCAQSLLGTTAEQLLPCRYPHWWNSCRSKGCPASPLLQKYSGISRRQSSAPPQSVRAES